MPLDSFGGSWTLMKLEKLKKYLRAYTTIMSGTRYRFGYIDAFAGTGYIKNSLDDSLLFPDLLSGDGMEYRSGSARIALDVSPGFQKYIFIEKSIERCGELEQLKQEYPEKQEKIEIVHSDCNAHLLDRCHYYNWKENRAVLFLDPFGMQVGWETIEAIASTRAIDLWYLFPIGMGVNRLLSKDGKISEAFVSRLDWIFGTHEWKDFFYHVDTELGLFGDEIVMYKDANFARIKDFIEGRLRRVFPEVAKNPLLLRNSRNSPLFLFCFAAGNPRGAELAVKIAQDILKE
jgi:three-Cys-motif partner protein